MGEHVAFLPVVRLDSASSNRICPPTSGDIASTAGTFSISTPPRGSAFGSLEEGPAHGRARRIPSSCAPRFGKFQPNLPPNLWGHRFNGGNFFNFHPPPPGVGFWVTNEGEGG